MRSWKIGQTARLLELLTDDTNMSHISLNAMMIKPYLLLQKPSFKSKAKEHTHYLERVLINHENGQLDVLMSE